MKEKEPVFVIAEVGVNHNGDISLAKKLVEEASKAGANAVKFQTFQTDHLVTKDARQADYQTENIGAQDTQYNMLKKLELSHEDHINLISYCKEHGVQFMSSAFDIPSARFLIEDCQQNLIKLGSGELTNAPLLYDIAQSNVNVIISTGMSTLDDIQEALGVLAFGYFADPSSKPSISAFQEAFKKHKDQLKNKVQILQCTSNYPCAPQYVNLNAMDTLHRAFGCIVGFSDHTIGIHIPIAAVAKGARIIEKHFTLDRAMEGPDHKASLEPNELKTMIDHIRDIEVALGHGERKPYDVEKNVESVARKGIVAAQNIKAGEIFTKDNLTTKRPKTGMRPIEYWDILGKDAKRDYQEDEPIEL